MKKWDPGWESSGYVTQTGHWVHCKTHDNYWAGAKKACDDIGMSLPDDSKLESIYHKVIKNNYTGIPEGYYWSSKEYGSCVTGIMRSYDGAIFNTAEKYESDNKAVCVGD